MKKIYPLVFFSVTFLLGTVYAQECYWETKSLETPSSFRCGEIQDGCNSYYTEPMVVAPAPTVPTSSAPVVELPSRNEAKPVLPQQAQDVPSARVEKPRVKPVEETAKVLDVKNQDSFRPSTKVLQEVRSEGKFELEGDLESDSELLQSTWKRRTAKQDSQEVLSLETSNQIASPVVRTPIVAPVKVQVERRSQVVSKYPIQDLKMESPSRIATPLVQRVTKLADVETQVPVDVPRDSFEEIKSPLEASQALAQSPPETTRTQKEPANSFGFNSDELDFGELPLAAATSVEQTATGVVARGSASAGAIAKKTVHTVKQRRKKAAAGWWWAFLPLLLLPLLGWFVWGLFAKREQEEANPVSEELPSAGVPASSGVTGAATLKEEVSTEHSLGDEAPRSGLAYASGATTTPAITDPVMLEKPVAVNELKVEESEKAASAVALNSTESKASVDQKIVSKSSVGQQSRTELPIAAAVDAGITQRSSNKEVTAEPTSPVVGFSDQSKHDVANGVQSRDRFVVSGTPQSDPVEPSAPEVKIDSAVETDSARTNGVNAGDAASTTAAITAGAGLAATAFTTTNDHSGATETSKLNVAGGLAGGNGKSSAMQFNAEGNGDDLTQIAGISEETQQVFYKAGYYRFSDIQNATTEDLKKVFENGKYQFTTANFKTWSSQAAVQCSDLGESTKDETDYGDDWTQKATAISESLETRSDQSGDDLTKINGIGPATASLLRQSGITTFRGLREAGTDRLQAILYKGGSKFKLVDPRTWTEQSRFATNGDWIGLSAWQAKNCVSEESSDASGTSSHAQEVTSKGSSFATSGTSSASMTSEASAAADDLTKINGIGPATASLLRQSGITSFRGLREASTDRLQAILYKGGPKFKLVDPSTWIEQARFATAGDWTGLSAWQATRCVAEENKSAIAVESEVTENSVSSGKQFAKTAARETSATNDDLTKISGCGQASKKVLNQNGIYSFAQVASMTSQQLGKLFAAMPKRFQLIDTSTWPAQARAFAGTGTPQQTGSLTFEMELLDEIDEIQDVMSTRTVSSTTSSQKKTASKRDQ